MNDRTSRDDDARIETALHDWVYAVDAVSDLIFMHDAQDRIVRANRAYATRAGLDVRELVGKPFPSVFPPSRESLPHCTDAVARNASFHEHEVRMGDDEIYLVRAFPVPDEQGRPTRCIHIMQNISARRRAELAAERSEARYHALVDLSSDFISILDRTGVITYASPAVLRVTGYRTEELVGRNFESFLHPDDVPEGRASMASLLRGTELVRRTLRYRHANGTWIALETVSRNLLDDPHISGIIVNGRDVTERERAAAASARLAAIVHASTDAIIGASLEGEITSWNPGAEKIYGYSGEEAVGRRFNIVVPPDRVPEVKPLLERVRRGESIEQFETQRVCKDGTRIDVSLAYAPVTDPQGRITGTSVIARDITEKKRAEQALLRVNRALKALGACNAALVHAADEAHLLEDMCRVIVESAGYRRAWAALTQEHARDRIHLAAQFGAVQEDIVHGDPARGIELHESGPIRTAMRTGEPRVVRASADLGELAPWLGDLDEGRGDGPFALLPLVDDAKLLGVFVIHAGGADAFDEEEIALLGEVARDAAYGIAALRTRVEHRRSEERLRRSLDSTIEAIVHMVETRDPYTAGHERRVAVLAVAIARELGLSEHQVEGVHFAGLIHDVGKMFVPAEILSKPTRLNAAEFALIKLHPEAGYDILKGIEFPWPVADVVLQHHERLDGSGYPRGLTSAEIRQEAKVLAVADTVEAMASHRPYRPGLGVDAALAQVTSGRGTLYDPGVVDACLRLYREKGFTLPE